MVGNAAYTIHNNKTALSVFNLGVQNVRFELLTGIFLLYKLSPPYNIKHRTLVRCNVLGNQFGTRSDFVHSIPIEKSSLSLSFSLCASAFGVSNRFAHKYYVMCCALKQYINRSRTFQFFSFAMNVFEAVFLLSQNRRSKVP